MVGLVVLTSGALAAGIGIYRYFTQNVRKFQSQSVAVGSAGTPAIATGEHAMRTPLINAIAPLELELVDLIPRTEETKEELHRGFNSSALSLGLASTGFLFFTPLHYASVPVLIYMGAPSARRAYDLLYEEGRPSRALAETAILAICLGGGWYLVGSLGFWLYYVGRIAYHNRTLTAKPYLAPWALPQAARLIKGIDVVLVPPQMLQIGDEVLVKTSDVIPADGVISDGVAWVQPAGATDVAAHCLKRSGDRVMATDIVIVGRCSLRVQKGT